MAVKETIAAKPASEKGQKSTRHERGIALAVEHFDAIWRVAPYVWEVPSCFSPPRYRVDLRDGVCSCPDRAPEGEECKHATAARYVKARTATCSGCGGRYRHSELRDVEEDGLTLSEGALVCAACALAHDVL
jgi:hypothetical protein